MIYILPILLILTGIIILFYRRESTSLKEADSPLEDADWILIRSITQLSESGSFISTLHKCSNYYKISKTYLDIIKPHHTYNTTEYYFLITDFNIVPYYTPNIIEINNNFSKGLAYIYLLNNYTEINKVSTNIKYPTYVNLEKLIDAFIKKPNCDYKFLILDILKNDLTPLQKIIVELI